MNKRELEIQIDKLHVKIENISNKKRIVERKVSALEKRYNESNLSSKNKDIISNKIEELHNKEYDLSCNLYYFTNEIESLEYEYCNLH